MEGCYTCFKLIETGRSAFYLTDIYFNNTSSSDTISIKDKLQDCVPELLTDVVNNAVLCEACVDSVTAAYNFRQQCLKTQQKMHEYLRHMPSSSRTGVAEIANYYSSLDLVAQTETFTGEVNEAVNVNAKTVKIEPDFRCKIEIDETCSIESDESYSSLHSPLLTGPQVVKTEFVGMRNDMLTSPPSMLLCVNNRQPGIKPNNNMCSKNIPTVEERSWNKCYSCLKCKAKFKEKWRFMLHKKKHGKPFCLICRLCGFRCNMVEKLRRHALIHCRAGNLCGFQLKMLEIAQYRAEMHNGLGEYLFQCEMCSCKFKTMDELEFHARYKHNF